MSFVADQLKVIDRKRIDVGDRAVEFHLGKRHRLTGELDLGLIEMIRVEVEIAKSVDEVARFVAEDLCDHEGEKRIRGNVKRNSQEKIGTSLVELAAQAGTFGLGVMDVELKEKMAGWKGHFVDLSHVPR